MNANSQAVFQEIRKVIPGLPEDCIDLEIKIGIGKIPIAIYTRYLDASVSNETVERSFVLVASEEFNKQKPE